MNEGGEMMFTVPPDAVKSRIVALLTAQLPPYNKLTVEHPDSHSPEPSQLTDTHAVVRVVVPDAEIVACVSGRWTCPNPTCNATYHLRYRPPKVAGVCDLCGTALVQRVDDREETVRNRLRVYHGVTAGLL